MLISFDERITVESDEMEEDGDGVGFGNEAGDAVRSSIEAGDAVRSGNTDESDSSATKLISRSKN